MTAKIIAEIGVNHDGSVDKAIALVDVAVAAGADLVKFQKYFVNELVSKDCALAEYQKKNMGETASLGIDTQFELLKKLDLAEPDFVQVLDYCRSKKIGFGVSFFGLQSMEWAINQRPDFIKIPSGEFENKLLVTHLNRMRIKCPLFVSCGLSSIARIKEMVQYIEQPIECLMYCVSSYPASERSTFLEKIKILKSEFDIGIGYSDHTDSILTGALASSYGVNYIEKHITLSRADPGPDHRASLDPEMFRSFCENISSANMMCRSVTCFDLGICTENKDVAAKKLFYSKDLIEGHILTFEDLKALRSNLADYVEAFDIDAVIGKALAHRVSVDDPVLYGALK